MMHTAGFKPRWGSKALLWMCFDYPFNHLKVKKVIATVPEWNWRSRHFSLHMGFKIECLISDIFNIPESINGMYVMSMRREDCRWLDMPRPPIVLAPSELTNSINSPLASLPTVCMMQ